MKSRPAPNDPSASGHTILYVGNTWTRVPSANIPVPLNMEFGIGKGNLFREGRNASVKRQTLCHMLQKTTQQHEKKRDFYKPIDSIKSINFCTDSSANNNGTI